MMYVFNNQLFAQRERGKVFAKREKKSLTLSTGLGPVLKVGMHDMSF